MSFSYNWLELADVTAEYLNAQPVLGGLALNFGISFHKKDVSEKLGRVDIGPLQLKVYAEALIGGAGGLLGYALAPASTNVTVDRIAMKETVNFALLLPQEQLQALEELRGDDGLRFRLELSGLAMGRNGPCAVYQEAKIEANLSYWLELLQAGGAAEYLTVSMKLPTVGERDPLAPALVKLRSAQAFLRQGEYDAAASACRVCLEVIQSVQGRPTTRAIDAYRERHKLMNRQERLDLLQLAAYHLTNLAVHHTDTESSVLSRTDAALLVTTVSSLLHSLIARRLAASD